MRLLQFWTTLQTLHDFGYLCSGGNVALPGNVSGQGKKPPINSSKSLMIGKVQIIQ